MIQRRGRLVSAMMLMAIELAPSPKYLSQCHCAIGR